MCGSCRGRPRVPQRRNRRAWTASAATPAPPVALRRLGINVGLAPVVDVPSVAGSAMASRSFSDDPKRTSRAAAASVAGWRAGRRRATAKHFPGLGAATANTDDRPVTIWHSPKQLMTIDLPPFAAAIRAGVPLVMVSHARYPVFDRRRIASQSRPIIEGLLRDRLGFRGVVVTDSMKAAASLATGSITATSERAVRAGADLVLLTGRGSYRPVYAHLLAKAQHSRVVSRAGTEAAARVLALKGA